MVNDEKSHTHHDIRASLHEIGETIVAIGEMLDRFDDRLNSLEVKADNYYNLKLNRQKKESGKEDK